eukprot:7267265-Pyramimonas_sp.AAC.1
MQEAQAYSHSGLIRCRKRRYILRGIKNRGHQKKGTPDRGGLQSTGREARASGKLGGPASRGLKEPWITQNMS